MHRNAAHLFLGLFLALATPCLEATIALQVIADRLNDANGAAAPTSTLVLIVADTSGDGLDIARPGSIALNAPLNGASGDDIIVFRTNLSDHGTAGVLSRFAAGLDFASVPNGAWGPGDRLYLVWFPTLNTAANTLIAGTTYGTISLVDTPEDGAIDTRVTYISPNNTERIDPTPTSGATDTIANQTSSNPPAPEIALLGNNAAIADGSTTASTTNHTDFGSTAAAGSNTVVRTFTISNTDGTAALNITLPIEITGTHEADFTVTTAPATSVNAGGSTTFQVTFNPSAVGVRTATISITNSDADEGTYDFAISGTGTNSAPTDITLLNATLAENGSANAVIGSFSTTDADPTDSHSYSLVAGEGSTHNSAFTISGSNLTINAPADFETLNQYSILVRTTDGAATFDKQFTITVTNVNEAPASIALSSNSLPENSGANAVVGTLSATDPDANSTFTFSLVQGSNDNSSFNIFNSTLRMNASADFETKNSYTVLVRVEDNGSPTLGIERPLTINITDVEEIPGTISLSSTTLAENNSAGATVGALTLIDNTAVGPITYSLVTGNGSDHNGSFTVSPSGSLTINGVANFEQQSSYKIRVQAEDSAATPNLTPTEFTINVTNVNEAPVFVKGPDIEVPVGATTPQTVTGWATDIDDGDSTVTQSLTFNVSVTGDSIFSQPPAIASNGTLTYTPNGSTGVATVSVTLTDDTSINGQAAILTAAQTFTITAAAPGIVVMGSNNLSISNGDADPSITDGTDFGSALVSSGTVQRTFTIENVGNTSLTLGTLSIEGTDQADFTPTQPSAASIPAGGNTTFTVTFDPSAAGERSATVSIVNGDPSKNPFTFAIQGNGTQPGLEVRGNGVIIASTDTILRTENGTDFGRVTVLNSQIVKTFTITNTGSAPLNLTGNPLVALNGPAAGDFSVTLLPDASLQPQATTTFSIAFNPALPGQRIATVTIDNESTPFLFNVGGFGALSTLLGQTISFAPPAVVYVGQNPVSFPLEATATSGLPVSFAVTGPASLNGNVLTITSPGNVRIVATQPGGGNYAAARALVRVIAAKASPQSLTLLDLNQTYDGSPKPISVIGAQGAVITYVVNRAETPEAPTNAGTYVVKAQAGNVVKTGKLVIAKATLTVTPDDKRKFVGEANPALTFTVSGLLGTDTGSVVTRQPVLTTKARTTSYGGLYPINASGASALNYNFVYRQGTLVVESFAGSYESLLSSGDPQLPVGKLSIAIGRSSKTFTARLFTEKEISPLSFNGSLVTDAGAEIASGEDDVTTRAGTNYKVRFTLPLKGDSTMEAEFTPLSAATTPLGSSQNGKRLAALTRVPYSGAHTAILQPALPASSTVPAGAGWATASVSRTGALALEGRLGDGTPFTAGLSPDTGESPGYRLFIQPYKKPFRIGTYVAGDFQLKTHPDLAGRRYLDTAALTWRKAEQLSDPSYRQAFGPVTTDLSIDPWLPPTRTVTLASRLGLSSPPSPFVVSHSDTGITSQTNLPTELVLSARNLVSVVNPALNVTKWRTGFTTKNGLFSGSFELVNDGATTKRTVKFSGILRQPPLASGDGVIGDGHFVLPAPSIGGAATTGEVLFQSPPVQPNP